MCPANLQILTSRRHRSAHPNRSIATVPSRHHAVPSLPHPPPPHPRCEQTSRCLHRSALRFPSTKTLTLPLPSAAGQALTVGQAAQRRRQVLRFHQVPARDRGGSGRALRHSSRRSRREAKAMDHWAIMKRTLLAQESFVGPHRCEAEIPYRDLVGPAEVPARRHQLPNLCLLPPLAAAQARILQHQL